MPFVKIPFFNTFTAFRKLNLSFRKYFQKYNTLGKPKHHFNGYLGSFYKVGFFGKLMVY